MEIVKEYTCFNARRFSNPWIAKLDEDGKVDFSEKVGGYTGGYNNGDAGSLYVKEPVEGCVYAYGQKDYRGNKGERGYTQYSGGVFVELTKEEAMAIIL